MTAITFDTLKYVKTLKAAGFDERQAEALAEAQAEVNEKSLSNLVTEAKLEKELAPIRTDLVLLKWMMGIQMTGVMALILKTFFPH
ncbi:MAG: CCDC90 family protein [Magnetococcus sp. YQC-9]